MIVRPSTRTLIQDSTRELLRATPLEKLSVKDIAGNCGISVRTFYNNFCDKFDVVSSIYIDATHPHLDDPLDAWYSFCEKFILENTYFFRNTSSYLGQNSLSETTCQIDIQKCQRHIKPEVYENPELYQQILIGIDFMAAGNIGIMNIWMKRPDFSALYNGANTLYGGLWSRLSSTWPSIVMENLSMEPVIRVNN